ncbi:MAG: STAS domain-containing protein [Jatrophihabitantaceae bacterium]
MPESPAPNEQPSLAMSGDVDMASEPEWRRRGEELLAANPAMRDVVVDMSRVDFLDSRGMAVLVELHTAALGRGGKLRLLGVPPRVLKALGVAGLDQVFQIRTG